jgi:putative sigma-54 modulation protein
MPIDFKFRHLEPSEAMKTHTVDKLGKLQKYLEGPIDAQVVFSVERHLHVVDVHLHDSGEHYQGREEQEDMYASIDLVIDKLLRQLTRAKDQHHNHRRGPRAGEGQA